MVIGSNILAGSSGQGGAYEILQSLRFNDNDTAFLKDAAYSSSPTSATDCTLSFWVKRCNLSTTQCLFFGGDGAGSTWEVIRFESDDQFRVGQASSAYDIITTQVFRDVSAWSNFVIAFNGDDSTAADRIKIYHNGSRITDFSLQTNPSSGYVTNFNSGGGSEERLIGFQGPSSGGSNAGDFYLSEINFVDGQALDPTSFGKTSSDTGQWVPIDTSGLTFGTNGYRITGADSSDLGADQAGSNDFTSSGLTSADSVPDSPTPSADSAIGNRATLMSIQDGSATMSEGNTRFSNSGGTRVQRTTNQPLVGKTYWEVLVNNNNQNTAGVSSDQISTFTNDTFYNQTTLVAGFDNANFYYNGSFTTYSQPSATQKWMFAYDADTGELWSGVNGTWHNSGNPAAGTGEVATLSTSYKWFPFIGGKSGADQQIIWGASNMSHTVPTGFTADLSSYRQPDPSTPDPSAYFQSTLYTGDGSGSNEINQTGNSTFEPSMVWIKSRSAATDHVIQDQVRGNFIFYPNQSSAEGATGGGWVSSFDSDGFTVNVNGPINASGATFVGWQWKAAGSGSSNTDGATSSTVSADTTSGFSIVTWTGTGSNTTVGHGLGAVGAPKMIMIKNRADADSWVVYHEDVGATKGLTLDGTAAATTASTFFNNTAPTSSVFTVGTGGRTNGSSDGMIAYCFSEVEGFSKIGSYIGNGSSDGPFVTTALKPSWLMIKRASGGTGNWDIFDNQRDPFNVVDAVLDADASSAEATYSTIKIDFLSNGFKVRGTQSNINSSGDTYIYMAFGDSFKTATAR